MNVSKVATALALSVALAATLAAAPQATKSAPAKSATKSTEQKADKKGAAKADMVKASDLPKAVTDAVMKMHPKATIDSATKSMTGTTTVYAVKYTDSGKSATVRLKEDGTSATPAKKGKGK